MNQDFEKVSGVWSRILKTIYKEHISTPNYFKPNSFIIKYSLRKGTKWLLKHIQSNLLFIFFTKTNTYMDHIVKGLKVQKYLK